MTEMMMATMIRLFQERSTTFGVMGVGDCMEIPDERSKAASREQEKNALEAIIVAISPWIRVVQVVQGLTRGTEVNHN